LEPSKRGTKGYFNGSHGKIAAELNVSTTPRTEKTSARTKRRELAELQPRGAV